MGLRGPVLERRGAEEPPCPCRDQVMSKAVTQLDAQSDMPSRVQRADNANSRTGS
jgi:hypothetical protein